MHRILFSDLKMKNKEEENLLKIQIYLFNTKKTYKTYKDGQAFCRCCCHPFQPNPQNYFRCELKPQFLIQPN